MGLLWQVEQAEWNRATILIHSHNDSKSSQSIGSMLVVPHRFWIVQKRYFAPFRADDDFVWERRMPFYRCNAAVKDAKGMTHAQRSDAKEVNRITKYPFYV